MHSYKGAIVAYDKYLALAGTAQKFARLGMIAPELPHRIRTHT